MNTAHKLKIQELLGKEIISCIVKGEGAVNVAYEVKTKDGGTYVVKQEREDKQFEPQNNLVTEARVAKQLNGLPLSVLTSRVVFISENPSMYGYEYIQGDLLRNVWGALSEEEKIDVCKSLGTFHADIAKKFTKEMSRACGIEISESTGLHPEIVSDYNRLIVDTTVPNNLIGLVKQARRMFDDTAKESVFHFIHNDAHHENILIKDKKISGIIDFGESMYGEVAKEFSRYIRDFPNHFQYIVSTYEQASGNKLSHERLVSNALVSGFVDIVEEYQKGGEYRLRAEKSVEVYKTLLGM